MEKMLTPVNNESRQACKISITLFYNLVNESRGASMQEWIDMMFGSTSGAMSIAVVFGTIAVAAFLVTMLVVKSSDNK